MNILLIVCDALRYDRLTDEYMPNLAKLSRYGTSFSFCLSGGGHTLSSVPYILCSQREYDKDNNFPSILKSNGYQTGIIHSNLLLDRFAHGFDINRDIYKESSPKQVIARQILKKTGIWQRTRPIRKKILGGEISPYRRAESILNSAEEWIMEQPEPWFLWTHLMDTHIPYMPPNFDDLTPERIQDLNQKIHDSLFRNYTIAEDEQKDIIRLYDAEARYLDERLADFIKNVYDKCLIIITSDHGDEFGEYKFYSHAPGKHGPTPQLFHVPLLFLGKEIQIKRISEYVCHLDVGPTILDFAGIKAELGFGRSLKTIFLGGE
jgi:arylsulfatase A-like enzyme